MSTDLEGVSFMLRQAALSCCDDLWPASVDGRPHSLSFLISLFFVLYGVEYLLWNSVLTIIIYAGLKFVVIEL